MFSAQQTTIIHVELEVPDNSPAVKFTSGKLCCVTLNRRGLFTYHLHLMKYFENAGSEITVMPLSQYH